MHQASDMRRALAERQTEAGLDTRPPHGRPAPNNPIMPSRAILVLFCCRYCSPFLECFAMVSIVFCRVFFTFVISFPKLLVIFFLAPRVYRPQETASQLPKIGVCLRTHYPPKTPQTPHVRLHQASCCCIYQKSI